MSDAVQKPTKVSREGVVLIKSFEGFRPRAVQRADGRWVIGYGHTLSAREGLTVSEPDAELLLQYDLIPVVKAVGEVQSPLNQHQFDALASFAFSIGADRFRTSDVLARLNAGAPAEAADALIAWADESATELPPRRRAAERALFFAAPGTPVALADLLAAPLPPPPVTAEPEAAQVKDVEEEMAPFPTDALETPEHEEADPTPEPSDPAEDIAAPAAPIEEPAPEQPPAQPARQQGWPAAGRGAFHLYSPYALQAIGPRRRFPRNPRQSPTIPRPKPPSRRRPKRPSRSPRSRSNRNWRPPTTWRRLWRRSPSKRTPRPSP